MQMVCSYCNESATIAQFFDSEMCKALCSLCQSRTMLVAANDLFHTKDIEGQALFSYKRTVLAMAQAFVATSAIPDSLKVRDENKPSLDRFRSLSKERPEHWMPIKDDSPVIIKYGQEPQHPIWYFDGVHRACLAAVLGEKVRVWQPLPYKSQQTQQYQTLIFRKAIIPGERPHDRWVLLPNKEIAGASVLDLACSSGMDGMMNTILSGASYCGIDIDAGAVKDGNAARQSWEISDRLTVGDVNITPFPKADIVWAFACAKRIRFETIGRAIAESGAKKFFFETHRDYDDAESDRVLAMPFEWKKLGNTVRRYGERAIRELWMATC